MGSGLVVGAAVSLDEDRGFAHRKEGLLVQALVPEATVKALAHAVLPRLAGVNVGGGDVLPPEPAPDPVSDEFRRPLRLREDATWTAREVLRIYQQLGAAPREPGEQ